MEKKIILLFTVLILSTFSVYAHLDSGEDISKNGYIIDFGYSPEHIKSDEQVSFAVNFVNETTEQPVNITSVWVRISDDDEILFSGEMQPRQGNIAFTYIFPERDDYSIDFKFENAGTIVEEQSFDLEVEGKFLTEDFLIFGILLMLLIVVEIIFFINRKRRSK